jgi:Brp/Blh family beta-carotene 15,15'-monooxygenase
VTRGPGLMAVGVIVATTAVLLWRSGRRLETTELLLLAGTFCVAPPLAAFGVYFGAWHSVRHTGRLLDLTRERRSSKGWTDTSWTPAAWQLTKASTAPTLVALAAVAALWLARDLASLQAEVAVLLALTFPHAAAVWVLDRQQSQLT